MHNLKERNYKQKQQPNIYMQKTQGPKISMSSPNIDKKFKSKTLLDKQNIQPNVLMRSSKPFQNSFGAAKIMMRQSVDDINPYISRQISNFVTLKTLPKNQKGIQQKYNMMSKSNNFQKCQTERITYSQQKKYIKTQADDQIKNQKAMPIIEDCQIIKSQYQSSENSDEQPILNFSKIYRRNFDRQNNILVNQSLNYENKKPRESATFGPMPDRNLKKYQFSRQQERKMKNQIVNNIIMSSKAEMMRSCDFDSLNSLKCFNHTNKKAKYRLANFLDQDQEESFYCSKCAVNIARQGIFIEEISDLDRRMIMSRKTEREGLINSVEIISQKTKRQQEFRTFEKRLDLLKAKILNKLNLLNQKSEQMTKLDKKIQLTISNYDELIQILRQMRKEQVEKEDKTRRQKCREVDLKKIELSAILDNIKDTVSDIHNEKTKMMALKSKDFSFMFDSFVNKIASYEDYLKILEQSQLANDIALFDEKLDSEDLDEETLIDNIFKEMYERLTQPKLDALENSPNHRKAQTGLIKEAEMQSGGSSLFCLEVDESVNKPKNKAFRTLFENMKGEEMGIEQKARNSQMPRLIQIMNKNNSEEFQRSFCTVKYFKEQNFVPSTRKHQ